MESNAAKLPSEKMNIWKAASEEMTKASSLKHGWSQIKSKIENSIKDLQSDMKAIEAKKAHSPEEKALINRVKKFNKSQTAELKKYQKGMLKNGHRIEQQINATKIFAKQTLHQVENKLNSRGIIFKKTQTEMETDTIKASTKVKALNQKIITVSDNIDKIGQSHAELIGKIKNVQQTLSAEQQLIKQLDTKLTAAKKALKEFHKDSKATFDRSFIEAKLQDKIDRLESLKSGIRGYARLDDEALMDRFGVASQTKEIIDMDTRDLKELSAEVDKLISVMKDVKALDVQVSQRATNTTLRLGLSRFSKIGKKEETNKTSIVTTYLGVLQSTKSLERQFEKLLSKTPNQELSELLRAKQEQIREIGRQAIENKLNPNSVATEIDDAFTSMLELDHLQEYLNIAAEISPKKSKLNGSQLDTFIENTIGSREEIANAKALLNDLSARAGNLHEQMDREDAKKTELQCKLNINLMMTNDVRSRIDELTEVGTDRLTHFEEMSPQMIKDDKLALDYCRQAINNTKINLNKITENSFTYDLKVAKFINSALEWVNTEFEFCLTLETYVKQADKDPKFFERFSEGDRKLIKDFVDSARRVITTSRVISQKLSEEINIALMNSEDPVREIISIYNNMNSSAPFKFHLERLAEHATLGSQIISDKSKLEAWENKVGTKDSSWSQTQISEKFIDKGLLKKGALLSSPPLGDFAIRGIQRPMRYELLAKTMSDLGKEAIPADETTVEDVFSRQRAKSKTVSENVQIVQRTREQELIKPLIEQHSKKLEELIKKYVKAFEPDPNKAESSQLNEVQDVAQSIAEYLLKQRRLSDTFRSIDPQAKTLFKEYVINKFKDAIKEKHFPSWD